MSAEIRVKFNDLVWKEKLRLWQGRNDSSSQWAQDHLSPQVAKRNRYANVQPWLKSRIHLRVAEGKSDYINASPITLPDPRTGAETNYIATQVSLNLIDPIASVLIMFAKGPKQSGLSHFWHMIWHETGDVAVIVMLTQTHDGSMEKCSQYFPLNAEAGPYKVDPLDKAQGTPEGSVNLVETVSEPDSKIEIRKLCLQFGEETKEVWHFLFSGWPDFAVPENEDRAALLELLKLSAEKNRSSSNPRVVHCSAGVGRSGTFIALEHLLALVESGAIADVKDDEDLIYDVVNRLREQRMLMVQMDTQYEFLYEVVKEQFKERQRQLALQASGQHSPKLRKLASGMKAAILGEGKEEDSYLSGNQTNGGQGDESQSEEAKTRNLGESRSEERRVEDENRETKARFRSESQLEERQLEGQAPEAK